VKRARRLLRGIARRYAFLADLAHRADVIVDDSVAGAAIDVKALRIALNPSWCADLPDADLEYVLAHELLHAFMQTGPRGRGLDDIYWNFAHDLVINQRLSEMFGRPPPRGGVTLGERDRIDGETAYLRIRGGGYRRELRTWIDDYTQIDVHSSASPELANARAGQQGLSLGRNSNCHSYSAIDYDEASAAEPCNAVLEIEPVRPWPTRWMEQLRAGGTVRGRSWLRPSRRNTDDVITAGRYRVTGDIVALVDVTPRMLRHARRLLGQLRAFVEDVGAPNVRLISVDEAGVVADAQVEQLRRFTLPRALVNHKTSESVLRDGLWICTGCKRPHAAPRPTQQLPAFSRVDPVLRATAIVIAPSSRG